MQPVETVLHFMELINQHDAGKLAERMTEDHVFTDSLGHSVRGRKEMEAGWRGYYSICPDFQVTHEAIFADGPVVAVFGAAGGTIAVKGQLSLENQWRTPAAWRAVVENGRVKEWQVYADNKPVYDIVAKMPPGE